MNSKHIIQKLSAFFGLLSGGAGRDVVRAELHWSIGLGLATLFLILGVAYISFDFYTQFVAGDDEVVPVGTNSRYSAEEVERLAETYTKQEEFFNELRADRSAYREPVLESVSANE